MEKNKSHSIVTTGEIVWGCTMTGIISFAVLLAIVATDELSLFIVYFCVLLILIIVGKKIAERKK